MNKLGDLGGSKPLYCMCMGVCGFGWPSPEVSDFALFRSFLPSLPSSFHEQARLFEERRICVWMRDEEVKNLVFLPPSLPPFMNKLGCLRRGEFVYG